ncbi:hypothetical protein POTOM_051410 [Populus tomentosa]|uniref:DNA polymerase delta small subunit n=1 Tax=Populus tomentosa TaxID=118781 RepID=A0A8X8C8C1_POPTO|nr:hypothetical protein POTOM_051410 [Populus tomentosa]
MKLKPCILDEYSKERSALPLVKPHNFMHPDDHLVLEDESGRVKLGGTVLSPSVYVTGVVVALHGKETGAGDFMVLDVLEAGLAPQIEPQLKSREDKYVVFISGVNAGCSLSNPLQFQLLVDHITGHLGDEKEQGIAAEIVHVVIAGNSVEIPLGLLNGQNLASKDQSRLSEPVQELDILLTQIAAGVPMDIMPGSNDPANFSLPQQPLNRWLFPGSIAYNTFRSCTNTHCFELDGVRILGTSGQNIDDLKKYSEGKDELEFMERTLKWRHLAPTTPNTLGSEGQLVKLISIPKFCNTGMVAVDVYLPAGSSLVLQRTATVQHITKKSSDDLLRKFAEMNGEDDDANEAKKLELARVLRRKSKRRRRTRRDIEGGNSCESPSHYNSSSTLVERRSLLPPVTRKSALLRQLGIGRSQLKAWDIKNKSILASIKKARHYNHIHNSLAIHH